LGGYVSTTQWHGGVLDDLFSDITGAENFSGQVDYRCVFLLNSNGTDTLTSPVLWFSGSVAGGALKFFGVDPTAPSPVGSSSPQAVTIANSTTPPSGVVFHNPTSYATGIGLSNLPPNYVVAIWFQREAINSAAINNDGFTLSVQGNTGP
jgi:hypothetical protein